MDQMTQMTMCNVKGVAHIDHRELTQTTWILSLVSNQHIF